MENISLLSFICIVQYENLLRSVFFSLNINNVTYNFTKVDNFTDCENEKPAVHIIAVLN